TRPWARKHSWHSFREQYVRNRAQYDFWIQRYVEDHPSLLDELAPRLIQDFLDEPGADEEELLQEEHGYVIARAPDHPIEGSNGRRSWPPVRGVGREAVTRSRPPVQAISRPAESISRPRTTHDADESWLVNSSDEDTEPSEPPTIEARPRSSPQPRLSPHQSPRPTRLSPEPRHSVPRQTPPPAHSGISAAEESTARTSGNGAEDEIRAELDRQISLLDENGLTEAPEDGSNAPQSSVQRHRGKGKPKAFKIKRLSQNVNPSLQARHEEIADSELVYHIGNEGESAMIRRSSTSGTPAPKVGLGFAGTEEIMAPKSKLTRDPWDDMWGVVSRPPSSTHSGPRPLLLGTCIAHSTPSLGTDWSHLFSSEPTTPSTSSIRWSSSTSPLIPTTPLQQQAASLASAEAEIAALKLALSASSTMIKNLTKEKYDAVVASRRLAEVLKGMQEAENAWLSEKQQLEERIRTLETVAAILDAEGQTLGRQPAHELSQHERLLLESISHSSIDTTTSEMRGPQGPLEALRKLDPNYRISSPSPRPNKPGAVIPFGHIGALLLGHDISPSSSYDSAVPGEVSLYSASSVYEEELSYDGPPLPTKGRAVEFIMSFLAENSPSTEDLSRLRTESFRPDVSIARSNSGGSLTDDEVASDLGSEYSDSAELLSIIANVVTDVAPLNIVPRDISRPQVPVLAGPNEEPIFATADDLRESMERVAAALGRPRTADVYLEGIDEEGAEIAEVLPGPEDDQASEKCSERISGLVESAARAASKRRTQADLGKRTKLSSTRAEVGDEL
ncbi:hypothetical protein FRB90_002046, partial [Tulasnella sp. 427]